MADSLEAAPLGSYLGLCAADAPARHWDGSASGYPGHPHEVCDNSHPSGWGSSYCRCISRAIRNPRSEWSPWILLQWRTGLATCSPLRWPSRWSLRNRRCGPALQALGWHIIREYHWRPGQSAKRQFTNAGYHSGHLHSSLNTPGSSALLTVSDWSFSTLQTSCFCMLHWVLLWIRQHPECQLKSVPLQSSGSRTQLIRYGAPPVGVRQVAGVLFPHCNNDGGRFEPFSKETFAGGFLLIKYNLSEDSIHHWW
jgi:hypothetical protein